MNNLEEFSFGDYYGEQMGDLDMQAERRLRSWLWGSVSLYGYPVGTAIKEGTRVRLTVGTSAPGVLASNPSEIRNSTINLFGTSGISAGPPPRTRCSVAIWCSIVMYNMPRTSRVLCRIPAVLQELRYYALDVNFKPAGTRRDVRL